MYVIGGVINRVPVFGGRVVRVGREIPQPGQSHHPADYQVVLEKAQAEYVKDQERPAVVIEGDTVIVGTTACATFSRERTCLLDGVNGDSLLNRNLFHKFGEPLRIFPIGNLAILPSQEAKGRSRLDSIKDAYFWVRHPQRAWRLDRELFMERQNHSGAYEGLSLRELDHMAVGR